MTKHKHITLSLSPPLPIHCLKEIILFDFSCNCRLFVIMCDGNISLSGICRVFSIGVFLHIWRFCSEVSTCCAFIFFWCLSPQERRMRRPSYDDIKRNESNELVQLQLRLSSAENEVALLRERTLQAEVNVVQYDHWKEARERGAGGGGVKKEAKKQGKGEKLLAMSKSQI